MWQKKGSNSTNTGTRTPMLSREERLNAHYAAKQASARRSDTDNDAIRDLALLVNPAVGEINYGDDSLAENLTPCRSLRHAFFKAVYEKNENLLL